MQKKINIAIVFVITACSGGQKMFFSDQIVPEGQLYKRHIPEQVTAGNESNFAPDISADGNVVIYTSDRKGNKDIWQKASGGGFGYQLSKHSADDFSPVISPDGDSVAFVSRRDDAAGDISVIDIGFTFSLPGKNKEKTVKAISSNTTEDSSPAWFPDGKKLVFASRRPGDTSSVLMYAELSDRKAQPLSDIRGEQPNVGPDGKSIAYVRSGAIFIYDMGTDKNEQLTESGVVQDGHPRFSSDGNTLTFIRYSDDTNQDGVFNADDRATAWKVDLTKHRAQKQKNNFEIEPLTAAGYSALYPQIRPPFLYVALSTEEGLDIFRFPDSGEVQLGPDKTKFETLLSTIKTDDEKVFLLRKMQHVMHRANDQNSVIEYALREMETHLRRGKFLELAWLSDKVAKNFPEESNVAAISEVMGLETELKPLLFPGYQGNLAPARVKVLKNIYERLELTSKKLDKDRALYKRALAEVMLLQAKIRASERDFFPAQKIIETVTERFPEEKRTIGKAQLYAGAIAPVTIGTDAALVIYKGVIANSPDQSDLIQYAVESAVDLVSAAENPIEALQKLKSDAGDLPVLASAAHLRIAEIFRARNLESVYANELRQIVELYPKAEKVTIAAAAALSKIEEKNDRYEDAEKMLRAVIGSADGKSVGFKTDANRVYMDYLLRLAEKKMKEADFPAAKILFASILKLDPLEINAHKGVIDANFKAESLAEIEDYYENKYDKNDEVPEWIYFWSYLLTYKVDAAEGIRNKITAIDDAIAVAEESRAVNAQILQVHQTLGWLYLQKGYWIDKYYGSGSILADVRQRFGITRSFFGSPEPNWLELGIESFQAAYFLSKPDSIERAGIARNLAQTYYELKNFQKALTYYTQRLKLLPIIPIRDAEVEALVFRNSGRSAFQIEEMELAESLQRNALLAWEKLDNKDMIKYSIDALALTLRERKNYPEALQLYERLRKLHQLSGDKFNELAALTNMGFCSFQLDNLDAALTQFDDASALLAGAEKSRDSAKDDDSEAIQIDLGGQGSAAKGFNVFDRKNLLVTFKAKIFEKWQRTDMVIDQYVAKLALLKEERTYQIKKNDRPDKYFAEEVSIVANNLGELAAKTGRLDQAANFFKDAEYFAKFLRTADQKSMASQESINYVNYLKIQLRRSALGLIPAAEIKTLIDDITARSDELKGKFEAGDKSEAKFITQMQSAATQLAQGLPGYNGKTLSEDAVKNIMLAYDVQNTAPKSSRSVLLAFKDFPEGTESDFQSTARSAYHTFRTEGMKIPSLEWKFLVLDKQFDRAWESLDRYISAGGILKTPGDRLLLRQIFEKTIPDLLAKDEASARLAFRRFFLTKHLELANRTFGKERVIDGKSTFDLSPRIKALLELKAPEDLSASMAGGACVAIHRTISGKVIVAYFSEKSSFVKITDLPNSTKLTHENYRKSLSDAGVLDRLASESVADLCLIPSAELYGVQWESIAVGNQKLGSRFNLTFLPAVDALPTLFKRKNVNKHWISQVGSDKNPVEIKKVLGSRDYEYFDGKTPLDIVSLRKAEILQIDSPLFLNGVESFESFIDLNSDFTGQRTDLSIEAFSRTNQSGTSGAIFSMVVPTNSDLKNSVAGHEGWVAAFMAGISAGIPTMVLVPAIASEKKNDDGEVLGQEWKARQAAWPEFYKLLEKENYATALSKSQIPGRLIGYSGVNEQVAKVIAEEGLEGVLEEATESFTDQAFAEAALLYRKAYIYSSILGKAEALDEFLVKIYESNHRNRKFPEAVYYIEKLITNRQSAKDPDNDQLASDHVNAGISSVHGRMFDNAEKHLKLAETYFLAEEEWGFLGKIYEYRALNLSNQVLYQPSIDAYLKSHEYYLKSNPEMAALKLLSVANIYARQLSQYDKALEYFDVASAQLKKLGKDSYLSVIVDKANTLLAIGQIDAAIAAIETEVLPAIDEEDQISLWIRANQSLANIYFRGGKFPQARELTEKIIAQTQRIEDLKTRTERTNDAASLRAMVLAKTGNYTEAFEEFRKAIKLAVKYGLKGQVALLYNNYGFWAREYGAIEQSIRFFEIAQRIDEELASESSIAYDQRNIGISAIVKGDYGRAENLLSEALKTSEKLNLAYNLAYCQFGLGDMEKTKGAFPKAAEYYQKALNLSETAKLSDLVWRAQSALGFMSELAGDHKQAEVQLRAALATIESLSPGLKTENSRNSFMSDAGIYEVYDRLIDILMKGKRSVEAWQVSERSRARGIIDTIASQKIEFVNLELNKLLDRERVLKSEIEAASQVAGPYNPANLTAKKEEYQNLIAELTVKNPKLLQFVSINAGSEAEIIGSVGPGQVLLQYHLTSENLHIWAVASGKMTGYSQSTNAASLKSWIREYREIMQNYSSTSFLEEKLSGYLIEPVKSVVAGAKHLIVVPHQALHFIPFAALKLNGSYLVETMSVSYLESSAQMKFVRTAAEGNEQKSKIHSIAAFGFDAGEVLPFTTKEVEAIKRFFPDTKVFLGAEASKAALKNIVGSVDALHIASHGTFNTSDPTQSYLELAGGSSGRLTVQDIFGIPNKLSLVTLSACETGIGEISFGDEIISMHRAFSVAGARSIISNLWRINDVTSAVVMKRFYRALAAGKTKTEALREAQSVARMHFGHPAYWASYRLVGGYL